MPVDDRRAGQAFAPTLKALDSFLSVVDTAKETPVPIKGSVWEVAEDTVPRLGTVESTARELRAEIRDWNEVSKALDDRLYRLDAEIDAEPDEEVDYDAVARQFSEAVESMERLEAKSEELEERLEETAEKASEVARTAADVPVLGAEMHGRLEDLSRRLSDSANEVRSVNRKPRDVIEVYPRGGARADEDGGA